MYSGQSRRGGVPAGRQQHTAARRFRPDVRSAEYHKLALPWAGCWSNNGSMQADMQKGMDTGICSGGSWTMSQKESSIPVTSVAHLACSSLCTGQQAPAGVESMSMVLACTEQTCIEDLVMMMTSVSQCHRCNCKHSGLETTSLACN
jgi:hypothetical protein